MATRSTIALEFADGTVSQVYCHWDGYLENNGVILQDNYSDPFKLRDLIDLGDISSLGKNIGTQHPFSPFEGDKDAHEAAVNEGATTFYGRDRGEAGCEARRYQNADEYFDTCQTEEYDYILRNVDGKATWFVRCYATDGVWCTISEAVGLIEQMNKEGAY